MVCDECKKCFNYLVCENGCYGNEKPCDFLETDKTDIEKEEINIFKKELNSNIQRLSLTKEEVIRIVESLYN